MRFLLLLVSCCTCVLGYADVCLVMVVGNHEAYIEKSLESVRNLVDCICICDIGSSDQTLPKIRSFMERYRIPGEVVSTPWISLGYNKTVAVAEGKRVLQQSNLPLEKSYLLVLNPEMIVTTPTSWDPSQLTDDLYCVLCQPKHSSYYRYQPHFLKASLSWNMVGIIDDVWESSQPHQTARLSSLRVDDGTNPVEVSSTITALTQTLRDHPRHPGCLLSLAQCFKQSKQYEQAIQTYETRMKLGGDREEVWMAQFMIGACYQEMGHWDKALWWYLEAHQYHPRRLDSLLPIARYYRERGHNDLAYLFARYGVEIPWDDSQEMFSSLGTPHHSLCEDISIAGYYTPFRANGLEALHRLLVWPDVPSDVIARAYRNLMFYVARVPQQWSQRIDITTPIIREGFPDRYHTSNPSVVATADGYEVICRAVNYTQVGAREFNTLDPQGIYRTKNFLLIYNRQLELVTQQELTEHLNRPKVASWRATMVQGLEDCRLFHWRGARYFTCTTMDTSPYGVPQISLGRIEFVPHRDTVEVDLLTPLHGPDPSRCEKNWLPFIHHGKFHVIYSYDPWVIYAPDPASGTLTTVVSEASLHDLSRLRGSAGPIPWHGGYLAVVHEVTHTSDGNRIYLHRFLWIDEQLHVQKLSKPFIFRHLGVEFCCGMTLSPQHREVVLGVGIEDRKAYLYGISAATIDQMLEPLPAKP